MTRRFLLLWAGSLLLAGCAATPRLPLPARQALQDFALEARFALRVSRPGQAVQSSGGRLSWAHKNAGDRILLANPLGIGLAEIEVTPALASLRTADGRRLESADADALMEEISGQRLPVRRLPAWLLGKADGLGEAPQLDAFGRPARLREAGWQIEYAYDDEQAGALPSRLTLIGEGGVELRLRIEEWKEAP